MRTGGSPTRPATVWTVALACVLAAAASPVAAGAPVLQPPPTASPTEQSERHSATVAGSEPRSRTATDSADALRTGSVPLGAPAGATETDGIAAASTTGHDIRLTSVLALTPERPGEITVTLRFDVPDRVAELEATIEPDVEVTATDGFSRADGTTYAWDGTTDDPTITYRVNPNRTGSAGRLAPAVTRDRDAPGDLPGPEFGPELAGAPADATTAAATAERYLLADVGPWALVRLPRPGVSWRYRGETVGLVREAETSGPGAVGGTLAFLGPHEVHERSANGQTFRLVVPEAAAMAASPADVLASLSTAADDLRVGDRDPEVFIVAAPTDIRWAVRGLQTGDADAWVRADEPLNATENAWLHEYVHTRQAFETTAATRWVTEGSADYYAALLTLQQDRAGFDAFREHLARGTGDPYTSVVLAEPDTWTAAAQYRKGALVAGELDRRIRLATGAGATFATVLAAMNRASDPVTGERFLALVEDAANASVRREAARFTGTEATPEPWTLAAHEDAFGTLPARVSAGAADRLRVRGAYRNATATAPLVVVPGETVTVPVTVENDGGATGDYEVTLAVDDRRVANASGRIDPGESLAVRLSWTADETGTYTLTVDERSYEVRVREPASPTVSELRANRTTVPAGGTVLVVATIRADPTVPTDGDVVVALDGEPVATERVRLGPNRTLVLEVPVSLSTPGEHVVAVGDRRVRVTVESTATTAASERPTDEPDPPGVSVPGFGPAAALVALVALGLALAGNRRRGER